MDSLKNTAKGLRKRFFRSAFKTFPLEFPWEDTKWLHKGLLKEFPRGIQEFFR